MKTILVSAKAAPGKEIQYYLAWKHRVIWLRLHKLTPWWQFRKSRRRFNEWSRAIDRVREFGRDVILCKEEQMPRGIDREFPEIDQENVLKEVLSDTTFHIGQGYEKLAVVTLECIRCGGREFNVGQGSYFTVLRCPKCKWETCVHDG